MNDIVKSIINAKRYTVYGLIVTLIYLASMISHVRYIGSDEQKWAPMGASKHYHK